MSEVCDICGDIGIAEVIAICSRCHKTREHIYCMNPVLCSVPKSWYCEACRYHNNEGKVESLQYKNQACRVEPVDNNASISRTLLRFGLKNLPHSPAESPFWKGSFEILNFHRELYDGVQAYRAQKNNSSAASLASNQMPRVLQLALQPRVDLWPEIIDIYSTLGSDIAIYFWVDGFCRSTEKYNCLLGLMEKQDLSMQTHLDGVDLLLFSSRQLPAEYQRINGQFYLWGIFLSSERWNSSSNLRGKEHLLNFPLRGYGISDDSMLVANEDDNQTGDVEIDMVEGSEVQVVDKCSRNNSRNACLVNADVPSQNPLADVHSDQPFEKSVIACHSQHTCGGQSDDLDAPEFSGTSSSDAANEEHTAVSPMEISPAAQEAGCSNKLERRDSCTKEVYSTRVTRSRSKRPLTEHSSTTGARSKTPLNEDFTRKIRTRSSFPNPTERSVAKDQCELDEKEKSISKKEKETKHVETKVRQKFRSSFMPLLGFINDHRDQLTAEQDNAMKETPFAPIYIVFKEGKIKEQQVRKTSATIVEIVRKYCKKRELFKFGKKWVNFTVKDVATMFGLPAAGRKVVFQNRHQVERTDFARRTWADFGRSRKVKKHDVESALRTVLKGDKDTDLDDFVRLMVTYMVMTIFLPNASCAIDWSFFHFVDVLENLKKIAWAAFFHQTLVEQLKSCDAAKPSRAVTGCSIALLYFACEHMKLIDQIEGNENYYPRFARWDTSKLQKALEENPIDLLPDSKIIVELQKLKSEEINLFFAEDEEDFPADLVVDPQESEILLLKLRNGGLVIENEILKEENLVLKSIVEQQEEEGE